MEKTITIDDKQVKFESKGSTPLRYKKQFNSDFFTDLMKMQELAKIQKKKTQPTYEEIKSLDMEVFYNICWVLAKTADPNIPEPLEWLDKFDVFPLVNILTELQELITASLQDSKKK
ncbi:hypothetical protein [Tuberibacillus sp. Marseille-P3662]|uniref:hypothetical protein n=1 Tax=Tuberibacillus sp. Marseille-P3662 TaxID=1965358 RepID=UPI000A1CC3A4|nr:hypothetical protein [Tuberibacillus sp. Marseille-P3662]